MNKTKKDGSAIPQLEEKIVRELVSEGREKGFVTIDEINENLGDETPSAEQLEKIFPDQCQILQWIELHGQQKKFLLTKKLSHFLMVTKHF